MRFNDSQNWNAKTARKFFKEGKARIETIKLGEKARVLGEEARIQGQAARIVGEKERIDAMKAEEMERIAWDQARIIGDKVRVEVSRSIFKGAKGNFYFYKSTDRPHSTNKTMELDEDYIKKDAKGMALNGVKKIKVNGWGDNTKVSITWKEVSKGEFEAMKPENITINKQDGINAKQAEIRVQTKN